ncbi:MAG TPA: hypothetical protein VGW78_02930 [Candidatus Babeliales bacterium]|jgi:hypothetical protein|nr:hypothetical protein [Candidatus Babeliales bacterium]
MNKEITYKGEHCCLKMENSIHESNNISPWVYNARQRSYYVKSLNHPGAEIIDYCPFCGKKLPNPLFDEWWRILEEEYGFDNPGEAREKNKIPAEFQTDEWWKKRGL